MRVVLDTNVLVAAAAANGLCRQLVRKNAERYTPITLQFLVQELRRTLQRKFRIELNDYAFLARFLERTQFTNPVPLPEPLCRDPGDDWVLATAVAGQAEFIVTGDDDLLTLKEYQAIRIVRPRAFLEFLDRQP